MTFANILILAALFAWLTFETVWDIRDHNLPIWFSLTMLVPSLAWLGYTVSPWAAILMAISIACTELYQRTKMVALIGIFAPPVLIPALFPTLLPMVICWMGLAFLWCTGMIGGADALAGLALLLFFPSTWAMPAAILGGIIVWGILLLAIKYRKDSALRIWTVLSARARGGTFAGVGAYALAVLFFSLYTVIR